jgi:hypothetical protein
MNNNTGPATVAGALFLLIIGILLLPTVLFLGAFIGVKVVTLILAGNYVNAFLWTCLYSVMYMALYVAKEIQGQK